MLAAIIRRQKDGQNARPNLDVWRFASVCFVPAEQETPDEDFAPKVFSLQGMAEIPGLCFHEEMVEQARSSPVPIKFFTAPAGLHTLNACDQSSAGSSAHGGKRCTKLKLSVGHGKFWLAIVSENISLAGGY